MTDSEVVESRMKHVSFYLLDRASTNDLEARSMLRVVQDLWRRQWLTGAPADGRFECSSEGTRLPLDTIGGSGPGSYLFGKPTAESSRTFAGCPKCSTVRYCRNGMVTGLLNHVGGAVGRLRLPNITEGSKWCFWHRLVKEL